MSFMQKLKNVLNDEYNISVTENGAIGCRTSGKALLDLNFAVSSLRSASPDEIADKFVKAYYEDSLLSIKWLFLAGDVRQGLGERRLFRTLFIYLAQNHTETAKALMPLIPEYTRWDIVVSLIQTPLADEAAAMLWKQLEKDRINMENGTPISLCAKWLPSENASSEQTKHMARILAQKFSMTAKEYRQMLSAFRRHLKIVEVMMSSGKWAEIRYEAVPSRANLIYNKAFLRNDEERRREFLGAVKKGEQQIHADVLFPHDIVHSYTESGALFCSPTLRPIDATLEELWRALPDYVQGTGNTLCIADGSGSMTSRIGKTNVSRLDVANALAIYFSERCTGQFKDCYISFSQNPQFVDLSKGKTLHDKIEIALHYNEVANTNLEAVFELILLTAVKNHMTQADLPANLLILSDMEFDSATSRRVANTWIAPDEKLFETFAKRYSQYGYRLPRLIFWHICSTTGTIPVKENALGVALVSGFSPMIAKMVLTGETDPYKILIDQLALPRYDAVEKAVKEYL
ncbi:MAG: DUF2828 family protein [Lachnospiraceae bacterium]|nr:DUF2828 family protein [Lachnospiraceae bacterium]